MSSPLPFTIDTEKLVKLVTFIAMALLPGLLSDLLGRVISHVGNVKEKRRVMLEHYDDYMAKYKKLARAGKISKVAKKEGDEEPSVFQQAKEMSIPPEAESNPILKEVANKFVIAKSSFQTADMVSKVLGVVVMFGGYRIVQPMFKGQIFLKLPFVPTTMFGIRNMAHGGIETPDLHDAGAGLVYSLVSYGVRPVVMKLLGMEAERFVAPSLVVTDAALAAMKEKKDD